MKLVDDRTQECKDCGDYWFNGLYVSGTKCPRCGSSNTFFTGENGVAKDIKHRQRKEQPRSDEGK